MKRILFYAFSILTMVGCRSGNSSETASGTFEATEVIVSAQTTGTLLLTNLEEGQDVVANQPIGTVDTIQLHLKKKQLAASLQAVRERKPDVAVQLATLEQQISTAKTERNRVENLVKANAANQKQLDDADAQVRVLQKQLAANRSTLLSNTSSLSNEASSLNEQIRQINDQIQRSLLTSPVNGTVLVKYAQSGELAMPGKAIFKVANLKEMILRAYVTADQLALLKVGQQVRVNAELGAEQNKICTGTISWISSRSEFTPKTIQTRDERSNLVYALKVRVPNDGLLKIGMYGSIELPVQKH